MSIDIITWLGSPAGDEWRRANFSGIGFIASIKWDVECDPSPGSYYWRGAWRPGHFKSEVAYFDAKEDRSLGPEYCAHPIAKGKNE